MHIETLIPFCNISCLNVVHWDVVTHTIFKCISENQISDFLWTFQILTTSQELVATATAHSLALITRKHHQPNLTKWWGGGPLG